MTEDQIRALVYFQGFVYQHPDILNHVISACTQGLKDRLSEEIKKSNDLETCLMNHIIMHYLPKQTDITYKFLSEKIKELSPNLRFKWDSIIESMDNEPEKMSGKRKKEANK